MHYLYLPRRLLSANGLQTPKLPIRGNKRRMPEAPTPDMLKRMRVEVPVSATFDQSLPEAQTNVSSNKGKSRAVTVEDANDEEMGMEGDRDFAPGNDADYFAEEDDEGRFFGGGLTSEQKTILNIFEKAGGEGAQEDVSVSHGGLACLTVLSIDVVSMKNSRSRPYVDCYCDLSAQ